MNRRIFCVVFFFLASALAQDQPAYSLKRFFEGKKIIVKVDMPATNEGVDVYPEREFALNFDDYGKRLKRFGTAVILKGCAPRTPSTGSALLPTD